MSNNEDIKRILEDSYSDILRKLESGELTYEEVKDLMIKSLYEVKVAYDKKEKEEKVEVHEIKMPQVLYGPPPMERVEVHEVKMPQVLYGPPSMERVEVHEVKMPQVLYGPPPMERVEVHEVKMPQVLYGPPPMERVEVHEVRMPQVLYGPPPMDEINVMLDETKPKKNPAKPRPRNPEETDEEYLAYLENFYNKQFPNGNGGKARR